MEKSKQFSPDHDCFDDADDDKNQTSIQEEKIKDDQSRNYSLCEKFQSIEDDVLKEISKDGDEEEKKEVKLKFVRRKLKKVNSLIQQYDNKREQKMDKKSSFSQDQWHIEPRCGKISKIWQKMELEKHILDSPMMRNLQISYDVLPSLSRLNLLHLAVFPEKKVIKKMPFIYWLIAEDLATKSAKKTAQEAGEEIIQDLIGKCLIQPWYKNGETNHKSPMSNFTLNPWIRRMLISEAKKKRFLDFDSNGKLTNKFSKSQCLCLCLTKDNNWSLTDDNPKELTTIFNVNEKCLSFKERFFIECKRLKVLQLGRWKASPHHHIEVKNNKFLYELKFLNKLKYLSLRGISLISNLPSSITECRNLEILDLKACHNLERLPSYIGSLKKLTHLDMSQCHLLENMPHGLSNLSSLQVLKGFILGVEESATKLKDLAVLKQLRKLSILTTRNAGLQQASSEVESFCARSEAENLKNLTITWRMDKTDEQETLINYGIDDKFLRKLEKLDLRCYPHRETQTWLQASSLKNLKKLYIRGGKLEELSSDEWKSVEILRLKYLKNFEVDAFDVKKVFPNSVYEVLECKKSGNV
ncbi:hypothetical protein M9H77_20070 [Catharanthus roseus]|uniref:Uncharacterized protein n=1 Tax=Catharanthus roseus TaxID=4058 RepID=A0ACC0AIK7_CATRO|nr:hypothetical protein M9H77_20070 [Catharanthus roseus]